MSQSKKMSVRELAKKTGFSTATISRALNNSSKVSEETKQRIKEVLEENGQEYQKPFRTIGIIAASTHSDYYTALVEELIRYVDEQEDYAVTFYLDQQRNKAQGAFEVMDQLHVDGVIAISFQDYHIPLSENFKKPIVWIDSNQSNSPSIDWVTSDHYIAGKLAADILLEAGCTSPIIISGQADSPRGIERLKGFKDTLQKNNISFDNTKVIHTPIISNPFEEGREALMYHYTKNAGFDSAFVINDLRAVGALTAAKELGLRVPEDMKIIGYDGISIVNNQIFQITSIQQNTPLIARSACELLYKRIRKEPVTNPHIVVPVKLKRGTTV